MKKEKKVIPVGTTIFWGQTATGIFWICAGIFGMIDTLLCDILNVLFLMAAIIAFIKLVKIWRVGDNGDEMSEYNYIKAKAKAGSVLHIVLCAASVATAFGFGLLQNANISWPRIISYMFFILIGVHNLLIGVIFCKLEAE